MEYDVFISHASEDKAKVALPLALHLQRLGLRVWLDEFELTLGDSLRRTIDRGLSQSRYGVVILSPAFFSKEWPNKELDGLVARESGRDKVILPIWHNVGVAEVVKYSSMLADKLAVSTSRGVEYVADQVYKAVRRRTDGDEIPEVKREPSEHDIGLGLGILKLVGRWLAKLKKSVLINVFVLNGAIAVFVIVYYFYQPKGPTEIGAKALAPWQEDGCLYPGTVLAAEKDKSLVRFDFGDEAWITTDKLYLPRTPSLPALKLNADVYVSLESGRVWVPGQIKEQQGGKQLVGLNLNVKCRGEKTHEWATVEIMLLRK